MTPRADSVDDPFMWGVLPTSHYTRARPMRWALGASDICFTNPCVPRSPVARPSSLDARSQAKAVRGVLPAGTGPGNGQRGRDRAACAGQRGCAVERAGVGEQPLRLCRRMPM